MSTTTSSASAGTIVSTDTTCPGTPREYRARQHQRFQSLQEERRAVGGHGCMARPGISVTVEGAKSTTTLTTGSSQASPSTPRLRGSASLRAISAARAMRLDESQPLPGAAWPGHSMSQPEMVDTSDLPPRLPTSAKISSARTQPPAIQRSVGLPPRPRTPSRASKSMSSCARAAENTDGRTLDLRIWCH